MSLLHDKRLRSVQWKDLTRLNALETIIENTISIPWLIASWIFAYYQWYLLALPCSFVFFLAGLRQVHNGYHYALGLSKGSTELVLWINSMIMLAAMHAVKYNHLRHHKYCLQEEDEEGNCAKMKGWQALLYGPVFIFRQHYAALTSKNKIIVRYAVVELISIAAVISVISISNISFLQYHLIAMLAGEFLTSFFAVWTVHHDCDEEVFARTASKRWKNFLTYNMFYHLEHHLFPKVPTIKLPELSRRLKKALPDLKVKEVF